MRRSCLGLIFMLAGGAGAPAYAGGHGVASCARFDPACMPVVDDARLEQARGGFETSGGLLVSLGVERSVSINGNTVSSTSFSIADVSKLSALEAQRMGEVLSIATVVQNGGGNIVQPDIAQQGPGALLIQNSLNDQMIRSQTTINTSVNSMSMLARLNFDAGLRDALSSVVGPK